MIYNEVAYLIQQTYTTNDVGDSIPTETRTMVYCARKSLSMSRKLDAEAYGLKLAFKLVLVDELEYSGEEIVEFHGERYNVADVYITDTNECELTVKRF